MSSEGKKKQPEKRQETAALGCTCRRTTLTSLFSFSPTKVKPETTHSHSAAAARQSPPPPLSLSSAGGAAKRKGKLDKSVPVVKVSRDPCRDFRESMLHLIFEEEIFAWEDLTELLRRFLSLNSRRHHDAIFQAFSEIFST